MSIGTRELHRFLRYLGATLSLFQQFLQRAGRIIGSWNGLGPFSSPGAYYLGIDPPIIKHGWDIRNEIGTVKI